MSNENSFYTLLTSNASSSAHNTLSKFRNDLPEKLNFENGVWQVSLQAIAFDAIFSNIPYIVSKISAPIIIWQWSELYYPPDCVLRFRQNEYNSMPDLADDLQNQLDKREGICNNF